MAAPRFSVVIPTHNEEGSVPILDGELHAVFARMGIPDYEILHVDDGSTDRSADRVRDEIAKDRRVRLLRLARQSGETAAIEAGIRGARGGVIVLMDGDLQNDPADLPRLLARIDDYDCVCGYRANRRESDGIVRTAASAVANAVKNACLAFPVRDSACTYKAFKRECAERVRFFRGMHRFLPTLFQMEGFRVAEIPVKARPRRFGRSNYGILDRAFAALVDLLAVRWMASRALRYEVAEEVCAAVEDVTTSVAEDAPAPRGGRPGDPPERP